MYPSYGSAVYRELALNALQTFIIHLEQKYGDKIIGYHLTHGHYGEWFTWNIFSDTGFQPRTGLNDYSKANTESFRKWLKERYHNNEFALKKAWGNPLSSFESADIPSDSERLKPHHGMFFDPSVSRHVIDYFIYLNYQVATVLLEQAKMVKDACKRQKIVGVFFGYLWTNPTYMSMNHTGHLGLQRVLESQDIDLIASPYSYDNRAVGGFNDAQSLPASVALHGKLYFNEVDTETHMQQRQWRWTPMLRNPRNFEETKGLLIRDYAYTLTKGNAAWFMDLKGKMYNDEQIRTLFSRFNEIDKQYMNVEKTQNTRMAVVIDDSSFVYFKDGDPFFMALMNVQKSWHLAYIGLPFDVILLSDLVSGIAKEYKFYLCLNTFHVTPDQRQALHQRFRKSNATVLWIYAPGYIGDKLSISNMKELTGIQLFEYDTPGELRVEITDFDHPYTINLPRGGLAYGTDVNVLTIKLYDDVDQYLKNPLDYFRTDLPGFSISPRFIVNDPDARVLGFLRDFNKPGLAVKDMDGWTSVYSSAPIVPAELLRNIARESGCHVYSEENDVIYANENFLGIYSPGGGQRSIRLPKKATIIDLIEKKEISSGKSEFQLQMKANEAKLFYLKD